MKSQEICRATSEKSLDAHHISLPRGFIFLAFCRIILWCDISCSELVAAAEETHISGSKVVFLSDTTFQDYNKDFLLLLYYADWSGQSKRMFPLWSQLAEELDSASSPVTVGLIDAQEYRQNPGSGFVHKLPTVLLFHEGEILAHLVKENTVKDFKSAVDKFVSLSSEEIASNKNLVAQQLEEQNLERGRKAVDAEMQETLVAMKFESDVPTLKRDSFFSHTSSKDALVMIYTTWCDHCKAFKADWLALAKDSQIPGLLVAKINSDSFSTFPGARLVTGVPTILFLRNSTVHGKYNGLRKLEDVRVWAKMMTSLSAEEMQDALADIRAQELQVERDTRKKIIEEQKRSSVVNEEFNQIKELTNENFAQETRGKSALILFYTESGQRSQLMKPVWVALSKYQDLDGLLLARFPEHDDRWSQDAEFVHGYPTVLVARNGVIIERYEGVQKQDELHHYAQSLLELSDEDALRKHDHLIHTMQQERMVEAERERLLAKAEEKRREEEVRKAKQLKRKQKYRSGA